MNTRLPLCTTAWEEVIRDRKVARLWPDRHRSGFAKECRSAPREIEMDQLRRIPPWRRRDAEPGPIAVIVLISLAVLTAMWIAGFI